MLDLIIRNKEYSMLALIIRNKRVLEKGIYYLSSINYDFLNFREKTSPQGYLLVIVNDSSSSEFKCH